MGDKRLSVKERVQLMHYDDGKPERSPTAHDIYAAWALVFALLFGFVLLSFI